MRALRDVSGRRRPLGLAAVIVIQSVAALFFLGDAIDDLARGAGFAEAALELFGALALILGIVAGLLVLVRLLEDLHRKEDALSVARGDLADLIGQRFQDWKLTPAERDVGVFALKGLDITEIAALRQTATGTVRAQMARLYAKAGVSNRGQFAALFVEDLLDDALIPSRGRGSHLQDAPQRR